MEKIHKSIYLIEFLAIGMGLISPLKDVRLINYNFFQKKREIVLSVDMNNYVEQTFTDFPDGVGAIEIFPVIIDQSTFENSQLVVNIISKDEVLSEQIFHINKLTISQEKFKIKIPRSETGNSFLIEIQSTALPGSFGIWSSFIDSYSGGQLFVNGDPFLADISFVTYDRFDLRNISGRFEYLFDYMSVWFQLLLVYGVLFFVISIFMAHVLGEKNINRNGLSIVFTIALLPLLMFFCGILQIVFDIPLQTIFYIVVMVIAICDVVFLINNKKNVFERIRKIKYKNLLIGSITLLVFSIFNCFQGIPNSTMPWKDGLYHQQLIQNMVNEQSIPLFFPYHIGFHLISLITYQLYADTQSVYILGQMVYLLFFFSNYLLGERISNSRIYGLLTAIIITFYSPFGMLLLSWGKYPVLLGFSLFNYLMAILSEKERDENNKILYVCIILLGLIFIHWKIFLLSVLIIVLYRVSKRKKIARGDYIEKDTRYFLLFICIAMIYEFISVFENANLQNLVSSLIEQGDPYNFVELLMISLDRGGAIIWFLGSIGVIRFLYQHRDTTKDFPIWIVIILTISIFSLIFLPFSVIGKLNFMMLLQIILGLFCVLEIKKFATTCEQNFVEWNPDYYKWLRKISVLIIGILGVIINLQPVQSINVLCDANDLAAFQWININLPENEYFLISSELWNGRQFPTDGGGWLPVFTANQVIFSDMLTDQTKYCDYIKENNIEYVYIGSGTTPRVQYQAIENGDLDPIYYSDGISIYQVSCK
ncbi:MAG TPA: hypothetical protein DCK95_02370 [Anaerolineaceae bacterium]|nr:hypothetical protein [Anaerolineaceae bacterium]